MTELLIYLEDATGRGLAILSFSTTRGGYRSSALLLGFHHFLLLLVIDELSFFLNLINAVILPC